MAQELAAEDQAARAVVQIAARLALIGEHLGRRLLILRALRAPAPAALRRAVRPEVASLAVIPSRASRLRRAPDSGQHNLNLLSRPTTNGYASW